jgi:hypothetical protein
MTRGDDLYRSWVRPLIADPAYCLAVLSQLALFRIMFAIRLWKRQQTTGIIWQADTEARPYKKSSKSCTSDPEMSLRGTRLFLGGDYRHGAVMSVFITDPNGAAAAFDG